MFEVEDIEVYFNNVLNKYEIYEETTCACTSRAVFIEVNYKMIAMPLERRELLKEVESEVHNVLEFLGHRWYYFSIQHDTLNHKFYIILGAYIDRSEAL